MFLYCLFIQGSMSGDATHNAHDDCALCRAWSKNQAIKKFRNMYCDFDETNVFRITYNQYGIARLRRVIRLLNSFREIVNGHYINRDGSTGKHVSEE